MDRETSPGLSGWTPRTIGYAELERGLSWVLSWRLRRAVHSPRVTFRPLLLNFLAIQNGIWGTWLWRTLPYCLPFFFLPVRLHITVLGPIWIFFFLRCIFFFGLDVSRKVKEEPPPVPCNLCWTGMVTRNIPRQQDLSSYPLRLQYKSNLT